MSLADEELKTSRLVPAAQRPRDAATLIIVRRDDWRPRILMGQRHAAHVFLPNKFVFPGGRLDAADCRVKPARDLEPATLQKLLVRMRGRPTVARARGLAHAAIREVWEETGLLVGRAALEEEPNLADLIYFARAITPPGRTRRFDSRFFVCDAAAVSNLDHPVNSDELLDVRWFSLAECLALDLPSITRDILQRLAPFFDRGLLPPQGGPVSFQYQRGKTWRLETL
jgi:8-oxo-dGTP pyrophosphatase MutT (NUDIX family)